MQTSLEQTWNSRLGIFIGDDHRKMIELDGQRGTWGVASPCKPHCKLCSALVRGSPFTGVRKVTVDRYIAAMLFEDGTVRVFGIPEVVRDCNFTQDLLTSTKVLQLVANNEEISAVTLSGDVVATFSGQANMTQDFILANFSQGAVLMRDGSPIRRGVQCSLAQVPEITVKCDQYLAAKNFSVGRYHMAILTQCGRVFSKTLAGSATDGQADIPPEADIGVQHVSCGMKHTAYVLVDGRVIMRGKAEHGRTTLPRGLPPISQAIAMDQTTVLLAADGLSAHWFGKLTRTYQSQTVITNMELMASLTGNFVEADRVEVFFRDEDGWFAVNANCEKVLPRFEELKLLSTVLSIEVTPEKIILRSMSGDEKLRIPYQDPHLVVSLAFLEGALHPKGVSEIRMFKGETFAYDFYLDEAPEMTLQAILPEVLPIEPQQQMVTFPTLPAMPSAYWTLAPQTTLHTYSPEQMPSQPHQGLCQHSTPPTFVPTSVPTYWIWEPYVWDQNNWQHDGQGQAYWISNSPWS